MNKSGMTLMELLVAMVVTSIVVGLVLTIYSQTVRHSFTIQKRFFSVSDATVLKFKMDAALQGIDSVIESRPDDFKYGKTDGAVHDIGFRDGQIVFDDNVSGMKCRSVVIEPNSENQKLLQWDVITVDSTWVGGAVLMR